MNIHESQNKSSILAGDIGGTNCRLTLCDADDSNPEICRTEVFPSRGHDSLESILKSFLAEENSKIVAACFGVPGPVVGGEVSTTNLPWRISTNTLSKVLDCDKVKLVNDLGATLAAMPHLDCDKKIEIHPGKRPRDEHTIAIVAPGTGLGQACMSHNVLLPSEGGHVEFAPRNQREMALLSFLWQHLSKPRVSVERVLSGPGIYNIYRYLVEKERLPVLPSTAERLNLEDPAAVIGELAVKEEDATCVETLRLFARLLGSHAGNLALNYLCTGGLFIGGGIAPKVLPFLKTTQFKNCYLDKGRLTPMVESTPLYIVTEPFSGLLGAVHLAKQLL